MSRPPESVIELAMNVNNTTLPLPTQNVSNNGISFSFDSRALYAVYGLLAVLISTANGTVLYLLWRNKRLQTPTNQILLSLAVSDFITGVVVIPLMLACSMAFEVGYICLVMEISNRFLIFSTVTHLLVMTLERYLRITNFLHYRSLVFTSRTRKILVAIWVFSLFASAIQLSWIRGGDNPVHSIELAYDFVCAALVILIPLFVMTVCYVKIFLHVRKNRRQATTLTASRVLERISKHRANAESKLIVIFGSMIAVFILGCILYFLAAIEDDLELLTYDNTYQNYLNAYIVSNFVLIFRYFTALFNPIICTLFKQDFRKAVLELWKAKYREQEVFCLRVERTAVTI